MAPQVADEPKLLQQERVYTRRAFQAGSRLAHPPPGEEIVITGMAGRFPESDDVYQYRDNIFNKRDLVTADHRRWDLVHSEIPNRSGKINLIEKFDAGYFGMPSRLADALDITTRQILERSFEAIVDAGYNPKELEGTRTGVFVACCILEAEEHWFYNNLESPNFGAMGCTRSVQPQWISKSFGLIGPTMSVDTACSSSVTAFDHAYRAIREGKCDSALVCSGNMCCSPHGTLHFARLGVLSNDGSCKSFDEYANGYARSEAVATILLQKSKNARRIYAQIVHSKLNCDGFKEHGITFPSGSAQKQLLREIYQECETDPAIIDFLEAHATGTKVGDPEEIAAMDEVYCKTRKTPLHVGSVKSNLGHTEPSSGLCSIIKVLLSMENNCFIPNIGYTKPKSDALKEGRLVVVTEKMPWIKGGSGIAAINNFGFGGANGHVVLKRFTKQKVNGGEPKDDLPRLICVSGRTEKSIEAILDDFREKSLDAEFVRLLHEVFSEDIQTHPYRGYAIVSKRGELNRSLRRYEGTKQPLCLVFGGPNEKLLDFGNQLLSIHSFAATILRIHETLLPKSVQITDILRGATSRKLSDVVIGSIAVQLALVDLLSDLRLSGDYVIAYSVGEVAAAYAEGTITLQQAALIAYYISDCLYDSNNNNNNIVNCQVELHDCEIRAILPTDLTIVSHDADTVCTISGPFDKASKFVDSLKKSGLLVKDFKIAASDCHLCTNNNQIISKLRQQLQKVLSKPKKRSYKWITASINNESTEEASSDYFVNALLSPTFFAEAVSKVPRKSVMLEVGSEFTNFESSVFISLTKDSSKNIEHLLNALGRLYELGYNPKLELLYPKIQWPVSTNTAMVSPLVKWNHTEDWFVALYKNKVKRQNGERNTGFTAKDSEWMFVVGHVIDGRNLIPATGYLTLVWDTLRMIDNLTMTNMQVVFEGVRFHRATNIPKTGAVYLFIHIQKATGAFEVAEVGEAVVTGKIHIPKNYSDYVLDMPIPPDDTKEMVLTSKDIYNELKLRGYYYTGLFRGVKQSNLSATKGLIEWKSNWVAFMDNMLQLRLLQEDTRNLYVPTYIERLSIDAKAHIEYARNLGENPDLPVYAYKLPEIITSGGIQIKGLTASPIPRRKPTGEPVLESNKFVPLRAKLALEESVRVNTQIILENRYDLKLRVVEVLDESTKEAAAPLGPIVYQVLGDQPLIQPDITILSKDILNVPVDIVVKDRKLSTESNDFSLVIASNLSNRPQITAEAVSAVKGKGFILSREDQGFDSDAAEGRFPGLNILTIHYTDNETLVLLRKATAIATSIIINISSDTTDFHWLPKLQDAVKSNNEVLVVAQNGYVNGILGFVNCLRREPEGSKLRCMFVMDDAPNFDINAEFYLKQLKKGLAINIFKDGHWGTYRHLLLDKTGDVKSEHIFNNVTTTGDLSSLRWLEGPLTSNTPMPPEKMLVHVYYSSLNFRDIMTASGRISGDIITKDRLKQGVLQGFEFAGRDTNGKRVMGMVISGALASLVAVNSQLVFEIPNEWSMEDAATVPVTYSTALRGLVSIGKLKPYESVLIHAGTGGVGQAAINIALYYKCNIFTTVGTQEKRDFIREHFPRIPESHIGCSRDTSFAQMVFTETDGRGVDLVLNSLAEEKLQASARCLAPGGRFIEIGKFDLESNHKLDSKLFTEGRSFNGLMLDIYFDGDAVLQNAISEQLSEAIKAGYVKPLNRKVFKKDEVEIAFRYMAAGKHMGKVMIKLRDEEPQTEMVPESKYFSGTPRFYCNPINSYIVVGGLGGVGMELVDWFVLRGARKLVLVSRRGVTTGYQLSRIRTWKTYGVKIHISTADVTTKEGCVDLINESEALGPIEGIFNLAVVLKDGLLENQDKEKYLTSLAPKAVATKHLDIVTRELCQMLKYFVVFSSVSCGRGNMGQTNYGMANSIMERICEQRKRSGYPGLAIQWGAIGEVGLVAQMQELHTEIEIGGTLQQRISSCIEVMDLLLRQNEPIVSSMVVAGKRGGVTGAHSITDVVMNIMGVKDIKSMGLHTTFSQLGMDSMMAVEIKQVIEREYDTFLSAHDLRGMTFARLEELKETKETLSLGSGIAKPRSELDVDHNMFLSIMVDKEETDDEIVILPSAINEKSLAPKVIMLPGVDGTHDVLEILASRLSAHTVCIRFPYKDRYGTTIEDLSHYLLQLLRKQLSKSEPYIIVAYSFSCVPVMHMVSHLEKEGYIGKLVLIDGSPTMTRLLAMSQTTNPERPAILQVTVLCGLMREILSREANMAVGAKMYDDCNTLDERIDLLMQHIPKTPRRPEQYQKEVCRASYHRVNSLVGYKATYPLLKSRVYLFKPNNPVLQNLPNDYELQQYCESPVQVSTLEGTHLSILKNPQLGHAINNIIREEIYFKRTIIDDKITVQTLTNTDIKGM